ncbi:MAG: nuclear transport factor 2 family protein [Actinomycetota bacterium]|nr:nuclear transport factor 2 family protein [Actinomycetota bacterium]
MSRESVEIVVAFFESEDLATSIDALAEDVELVFHGELRVLAGADRVSGKQAAIKWFADYFSRFEHDYHFEVEEADDWGDDRVMVVTVHHGKGRSSGLPMARRSANVMTVRDGKIVRQEMFTSPEEALAASPRP